MKTFANAVDVQRREEGPSTVLEKLIAELAPRTLWQATQSVWYATSGWSKTLLTLLRKFRLPGTRQIIHSAVGYQCSARSRCSMSVSVGVKDRMPT